MDLKKHFDQLVETHGIKHWSFAARKDHEFLKEVQEATKHLPDDLSFAERVYCAAHNFDPRCPEGNRKKLISITKGWAFCGAAGKCSCAKAVISQKSRDNVDHDARLAKTRATLLERYGTTNPADLPQAKIAHQAFYEERRKAKPNEILKDETKKPKQIKKPEHERTIACAICKQLCSMITAAHLRGHGITVSQYKEQFPDAPMASEAIQQARREAVQNRVISDETRAKLSARTMGHKRNVGRVLNEEHRNKISVAKTGVSRGEEFSKKQSEARKGIQPKQWQGLMSSDMKKTISRARLGNDRTYEILEDSVIFEKTVKDKSVLSVANKLEVSYGTIYKYIKKYDIKRKLSSSGEDEIAAFLTENNIKYKPRDQTKIGKELDFYIDDHNLGIEYNGLFWHSCNLLEDHFHLEKWRLAHEAGIRLLMINEDEWTFRSSAIKNKILNLCGKSERGCGARKLSIGKISNTDALSFVDRNHIQGKPATCSIAYGAFWNETLVAVVTLFPQRGTGHLDLTRFCTDGRVFAGAFSKILKVIREEIKEPIVTFADLRYSDGGLYEKCGFIKEAYLRPDYKYVKGHSTYHKSLFTKTQIAKKFGLDMSAKTEREAMIEMGYSRIYDCGKIRYRSYSDGRVSSDVPVKLPIPNPISNVRYCR